MNLWRLGFWDCVWRLVFVGFLGLKHQLLGGIMGSEEDFPWSHNEKTKGGNGAGTAVALCTTVNQPAGSEQVI